MPLYGYMPRSRTTTTTTSPHTANAHSSHASARQIQRIMGALLSLSLSLSFPSSFSPSSVVRAPAKVRGLRGEVVAAAASGGRRVPGDLLGAPPDEPVLVLVGGTELQVDPARVVCN